MSFASPLDAIWGQKEHRFPWHWRYFFVRCYYFWKDIKTKRNARKNCVSTGERKVIFFLNLHILLFSEYFFAAVHRNLFSISFGSSIPPTFFPVCHIISFFFISVVIEVRSVWWSIFRFCQMYIFIGPAFFPNRKRKTSEREENPEYCFSYK